MLRSLVQRIADRDSRRGGLLSRVLTATVKRLPHHLVAPLHRKAKLCYYNVSDYGHLAYLRGQRYLTVFADINNICNLRCVMCSRGSVPATVRNMTVSEFERIGDACLYNARHLQVCCSWELSVSKYAPDILRMLPKYGIPFTAVITNGNFLSDELMESFFESDLNEVTISIGEATRETYEKIRVRGDFASVMSNIERLREAKRTLRTRRPIIAANLTIMRSNVDELVDFVHLAAKVGIEIIRGRHLMLLEGCPVADEVLVSDTERTNEIIACAQEVARAENIPFHVPYLNGVPKADYSCYRPWDTLYISSDGSLSVCPRIKEYEHLGNLLESGFEELFYSSEPINKLRDDFVAGTHNAVCRWCIGGMKEREPTSQRF